MQLYKFVKSKKYFAQLVTVMLITNSAIKKTMIFKIKEYNSCTLQILLFQYFLFYHSLSFTILEI